MIPVAFITDENFIMQTCVAVTSLVASKNTDTAYKVYIICAECSKKSEEKLRTLEDVSKGITIVLKQTSLDAYRDIRQLAHIPISCLLKFDLCEIVEEEDKLIYLDGDILVRRDLTDLYATELGENFIAGVPSLDMVFDSSKRLVNAGILLFDAKKMREHRMRDILVAKRRELGDSGSMDQQTYNIVLGDRTLMLPFRYNFVPAKIMGAEKTTYTLDKVNALYQTSYTSREKMAEDAAIWHFSTGDKPWRYSFIYGAREWYDCYLSSPFGGERLSRKTALGAHVSGALRHLKSGGIKALFDRGRQIIRIRTGREEHTTWG